MSCLCASDLYHTGIVVADLDAAMAELTAVAGYTWMPVIEYPVPVWMPEREAIVNLRMVYSVDEPRLELIRQVPNTPWMPVPGSPFHHIGYFVDNVSARSRALSAAGWPIEVRAADREGRPSGFAYHIGPEGVRVELVNRSALQDMLALLETQASAPAS